MLILFVYKQVGKKYSTGYSYYFGKSEYGNPYAAESAGPCGGMNEQLATDFWSDEIGTFEVVFVDFVVQGLPGHVEGQAGLFDVALVQS